MEGEKGGGFFVVAARARDDDRDDDEDTLFFFAKAAPDRPSSLPIAARIPLPCVLLFNDDPQNVAATARTQ